VSKVNVFPFVAKFFALLVQNVKMGYVYQHKATVEMIQNVLQASFVPMEDVWIDVQQ